MEFFRKKYAGSQADRINRAEAEAQKMAEQLKKTKISGMLVDSFHFSDISLSGVSWIFSRDSVLLVQYCSFFSRAYQIYRTCLCMEIIFSPLFVTDGKGKKQPPAKSASQAKSKASPDAEISISRVDIRIGLITKVQKHPDADSLYVEEIDVGESQYRTVVSGLVNYIPLKEMQVLFWAFCCRCFFF